jgi:hypothetical protein
LGRSVRFFFFPNLLCFRWLPASSPFPSLPVVVFCGKWRRIGRRRRMGGAAAWRADLRILCACGREENRFYTRRRQTRRVEDRRPYSYFILHRRCRPWALLGAPVGAASPLLLVVGQGRRRRC